MAESYCSFIRGQFTVEKLQMEENYSIRGYSYTLDDGKYNAAKSVAGKNHQITTGADGKSFKRCLV